MPPRALPGRLALVGPGLLVAATGVGAGDLATAAFAGSHLGTAVLWAVVVGAGLKLVLTEGLARWQLVTEETLLEGAITRLGPAASVFFALYLLPWTFFVGAALMSACGVTTHALVPVFDEAADGKVVFGLACSAVGAVLALRGGYRLFERLMSVAIGVMFTTVVVSAVLVAPDWSAVARGLVVPIVPDAGGAGLGWTVALMGGVGGTLTVLCYGYWIREEGRRGVEHLDTCRIDLAVGYAVTALFGLAMVVIGSTLGAEARGAGLVVALGERLGERLGPAGRLAFLLGAWCAVFSSLLGVWQAVPYLFADFWRLAVRRDRVAGAAAGARRVSEEARPRATRREDAAGASAPAPSDAAGANAPALSDAALERERVATTATSGSPAAWDAAPARGGGNAPAPSRSPGASGECEPVELARTRPYRVYLVALASVPALGLLRDFQSVQKLYAVVGALFLPLLAATLLLLNGRARWMGAHRNRPLTTAVLVATLAFFAITGWSEIRAVWTG